MSDTISPLAKQKLVLALLAQSPKHSRKHDQLRDCLFHIPHYIVRLYARTMTPETSQIRCALKHKCPKCMDPINVVAARRADFRSILKAARKLGGGENGEYSKVWVLSGLLPRRLTGSRLSRILRRSDSGCIPAITGEWAAESVCGRFTAIIDCNSPKPSAAFVFNSLVFGAPETDLDVKRLAKLGISVYPMHGKLGTAWQLYLEWWSMAQVTNCGPEQIVEWMTQRGRQFEAIGVLRGTRVLERAEHLEKLHTTMGNSSRIGFYTRLEQIDPVIARIAFNLPLQASNLRNRPLESKEFDRIMALVKTQTRGILTPEMSATDLPAEELMSAEELRARLNEILRILKDREKDSTSNRAVKLPDKIQ